MMEVPHQALCLTLSATLMSEELTQSQLVLLTWLVKALKPHSVLLLLVSQLR